MPTFEHVSTYRQPRREVFAWHTRPGTLTRLTPPGTMEVTAGPTDSVRVGSQLTFRLSTPLLSALGPTLALPGSGSGPLGLPWQVRHTEFVEGERFVDEQVRGPMRSWRHEHLFSDTPEGGTRITDRIIWQPPAPSTHG